MSAGHQRHEHPAVSSATIERIRQNPAFNEHLYRPRQENDEYDIPFIAGYSEDGNTIYYDRHLPLEVTLHLDGHVRVVNPRHFIKLHEEVEKALIDSMNWGYFHSHAVATAFEKRRVLEVLGPHWWQPYQHLMDEYDKIDEHEKITRLPPDLDMTPYHAQPVDKALLSRMQRVLGQNNAKHDKADVDYSEGMAKSHCGPVPEWPRGDCRHFREPHYCDQVRGYIGRKMWCSLWSGK